MILNELSERKEKTLVILISFVTLFLVFFPTFYNYLNTSKGKVFVGFNSVYDPMDVNTYLANMRQGFEGSWLWENRSTLDSGRYPLFMFFILLGHLARISHIPVSLAFHLSVFFLCLVLFFVTYKVIRFFIAGSGWMRVTCFLFSVLGGGFGWLVVHQKDASFPDANIFNTLHLPHFVLDQALFFTILFLGFKAITKERKKLILIISLLGVLLAFIHPFSLFVAGVVLGLFALEQSIEKRKALPILIVSPFELVSAAVILFFGAIIFRDPMLSGWQKQQVIRSFSPLVFLFAYDFLSVYALVGIWQLLKKSDPKAKFLTIWLLAQFALLYLPVPFQRAMIKGVFLPLCVLAMYGIQKLKAPKLFIIFVFLLSFSFNLFVFAERIILARSNYFLMKEEETLAYEWLSQNAPDCRVFSSLVSGNYLIANTSCRAFAAHRHLTPNSVKKEKLAKVFFAGGLSYEKMHKVLVKNRIDYVFFGYWERGEEGNLDLEKISFLRKVFSKGKVQIYRVEKGQTW